MSFAIFCRSSFLRVFFWENFRERTFVFGWLCWSCVFRWVFAIVFALLFGVSLPKLFGKIPLMSGLVFSVFVLSSFGFFVVVVVVFGFCFCLFFSFSRDIVQVVTGHPRTRTCFLVLFLFCVPPLLSVPPVLAVRPASWRFSGVPFWAPGVLGFSLDFLRPFLGTRGGKGLRVLLLFCFSFPLLFCGHTFSRLTGGGLTNPAVVSPAPRPSEGQGERPFLGGGILAAPLLGILSAFFVASGARDPRTHGVQGLFVRRGGLLRAPSQALFTLHGFSRPRSLFFVFFRLWGHACRG